MKNLIPILIIIILVGLGAYVLIERNKAISEIPADEVEEPIVSEDVVEDVNETVIGQSVEGRDIIAYHYGEGDNELLFIGGTHGGYSWNTALVAYEAINYLEENESTVPLNVSVTVVPVLNPDGLFKVTGKDGQFSEVDVSTDEDVRVSGRFNANEVDLNRNFDCDWQANAKWQDNDVSGGTSAFSEPESEAIKNYIEANDPTAVVVWYSAVGGVFASNCHNGVLPETTTITNVFADASGYKAHESFDFYEITGDLVNWLAGSEIPAISVLLTTHEDVEWDKNKAGIEALLSYYGN